MDKVHVTFLLPAEINVIKGALGAINAGENEYSEAEQRHAYSAHEKLSNAPAKAVWIPFSQADLKVLWDAITNGAEGVLQSSSGHTSAQRQALRKAANRIAKAGNLGPTF